MTAGTACAAESAPDAASEAELDLTKEAAHPVADLLAGLGNFCFFARLPPASQK
ncbi:hypothetical protein OH764_09400 [Burkholderia sp. M6-3]